jgi:hypothetical protein
MDNNLTISTLSFALSFTGKDGSERREVSRGVNLPEVMSVKHQPYVDSKTKVPGVRSVLRFDRYHELSSGIIAPVSAYLVVTTPGDTGIVSADVLAVIERIVNTIQEDDTGLDLADEIFVSRQQ